MSPPSRSGCVAAHPRAGTLRRDDHPRRDDRVLPERCFPHFLPSFDRAERCWCATALLCCVRLCPNTSSPVVVASRCAPTPPFPSVNVQRSIASRATMIGCYGAIDADGSRYLLSDIAGTLWLLALVCDGGSVQNLKLDPLGQTSVASAIAYLDSGVVYIGSKSGDSQLVRLHSQPDSSGSYLEVVETFTGLGPIVNFCVVDLDRQGQGQVVTCSGIHKDGSLRVVRNGVGINEQASVDLPGVKGLWALKTDPSSAHDAFLVVSFITETRVLAMNMEDELDETDIPGFDCAQQTLLCASVGFGQLLQVTPAGAKLVSGGTLAALATWAPPAGRSVTVAAADETQLLVCTGDGDLVYITIGQGTLQAASGAKMDHEISCLVRARAPTAPCALSNLR